MAIRTRLVHSKQALWLGYRLRGVYTRERMTSILLSLHSEAPLPSQQKDPLLMDPSMSSSIILSHWAGLKGIVHQIVCCACAWVSRLRPNMLLTVEGLAPEAGSHSRVESRLTIPKRAKALSAVTLQRWGHTPYNGHHSISRVIICY